MQIEDVGQHPTLRVALISLMQSSKPWLRPFAYVIGLCFVLAVGIWAWWQSSEGKLSRDLSELRSLGFPTTLRPEETRTYYVNRLEEYRRAAAMADALIHIWEANRTPLDDSARNGREGDWSRVNSKEFRQQDHRFDPVIKLLELSVDGHTRWLPEANFDLTTPREYIDAPGLAAVVTRELIRNLQEGDVPSALQRFDILLRLADDFESSPFSNSYAQSPKIERQITIATTYLLREIRGDKARLLELIRKLEARAAIPEPINAIKGDVAKKIDMLLQPGELERFMASAGALNLEKGFLFDSDLGRRIIAKRTVAALTDLVKKSPQNDWRAFDVYWSEAGQSDNPDADKSAMRYLLYNGFNSRPGSAYARCLAYRRLALASSKICLMALDRGLPDSVDSLGDLAQDPLGAGQFKYIPSGTSFILYSVGYDGTDNGGVNKNPGSELDIVVAVNEQKLSEGKV